MSWLSRVRSGIPFLPKRQSSENLWHKCKKCGTMVFVKEWEENYNVCPRCDLHDRIGQSLAYLAFELDRIVKSDGRGDTVGPSLEQLRSDIRDVIREVRDTLYDLRTDVSEDHDILSVLNLYLQRVRELVDKGALARQELDNAEAAAASARSDVAALGAEIASSAVQLRYYQITAAGKKQLASDHDRWQQMVSAIATVMQTKS